MAKSRRANAVLFGFDFQINAAIVLMLENMADLSSLRLEGNHEDIEIEMTDGKYILAQAKGVEKAGTDFSHVRENLKKALHSLSEGARDTETRKLILITNSPNPLNEEASKSLFYGEAHRDFDTLPDSSKELIKKYLQEVDQPLDTSQFMIQVLPFETDNEEERFKVVHTKVDDFIGELDINRPGITKKLMTIWQDNVFQNGTKSDAEIKLRKKDIVWPVIMLVTDVEQAGDKFSEYFDPGLYDEIIRKYHEVITTYSERFDFITRVLHDYQQYSYKGKISDKNISFANDFWQEYLDDLKIDESDDEMQEGLIKIILLTIVTNRIAIDHIKKGVGL